MQRQIALHVAHMCMSSLGIVASRGVFDLGFGCPICVNTFSQLVVFGVGRCLKSRDDNISLSHRFIGTMTILSHILGHIPYKYLTVAFIQMLKSLTPVVMVIILMVHRIEHPNRRRSIAVVGMCAFACVASAGEMNFHLGGVVLMLASSVAEAYRLAWTQRFAYEDPIVLMTSTARVAALCGMPFAAIECVLTPPHITLVGCAWCFTNGVVACGINLLTIQIVKNSGSTTLKFVGIMRNAGVVVCSSVWYNEYIAFSEIVSYLGMLMCTLAYFCSSSDSVSRLSSIGQI